ncbi:GNAT family N-acetyltransferase [Listeria costaricensis]|uniref:GNAT family N-acetyltransferase n=1 Tax=Listeria costaricensis TaxID=2026604 RepID=UPI000C06B2E3|nr:GNAT family N-acetyltransferase [Listeria costaricensis]
MHLRIEQIGVKNWRNAIALSVAPYQKRFIEPNSESILEAKFEEGLYPVGLYDHQEMIGFALYGFYNRIEQTIWLDRFMIDYRHQGKKYGTLFLPLIVERICKEKTVKQIYLSIVPGNLKAEKFYQMYGFQTTGETDEFGEYIYTLDVKGEV